MGRAMDAQSGYCYEGLDSILLSTRTMFQDTVVCG